MIERGYELSAALGLERWCEDEAGPYQAIPQPGASWQPTGEPAHQPHEYLRGGAAKLLTRFQPAAGAVRARPVDRAPNSVLHPWLQEELTAIVAALPALTPAKRPVQAQRSLWESWQEGLTVRISLLEALPPLRMTPRHMVVAHPHFW